VLIQMAILVGGLVLVSMLQVGRAPAARTLLEHCWNTAGTLLEHFPS
jgi:hypothetical protein